MNEALVVFTASLPFLVSSAEDPSTEPSPMAHSVTPPETGPASQSIAPDASLGAS